MKNTALAYTLVGLLLFITGCTGQNSFSDYARAGDTVALAVGWKTNFNKKNITVTITPSVGADIVIPANDPAIRASVNMYIDPVSSAVVSREVGKDQTFQAGLYGGLINGITTDDNDWYQTTVLLDLPSTLPTGLTSITIANSQGETATSTLEIIPGTGTPHGFVANSGTAINPLMFTSLQRTTNYAVTFDSATLPYAIEVVLLHDADEANGGTGTALAINHLGVKKNLAWNDDGTSMTAILTPATDNAIGHMNDFKFYVAGKIQNLSISSIQGYDINGVSVDGVTGTVSQYDL